jgi:hypothetical protein
MAGASVPTIAVCSIIGMVMSVLMRALLTAAMIE